MISVFAICIGASIGALARWGLGLWLNPGARIPLGTLPANRIGGCLVGGRVAGFRGRPTLAPGGRRGWGVARGLAGKPSFRLLDGPVAGIDPIAVGDIQQLVHHLKRRGIGVLVTDHNVRETLGLIDRAYILHSGHVLTEGSPEEIVANPDVRRLYLGEEFRL